MNKPTTLLTVLLILATIVPASVAAKSAPKPIGTPISTAPPRGILEMDDRIVVREIIDTDFDNFDADGNPILGAAAPPAVGCQFGIDTNALQFWRAEHPDYLWYSEVVDNTYFFNDIYPDFTFTLRASDENGIKRMTVKIEERDVQPYAGPTYSDGPTEFMNIWPSSANATLEWIWVTGGNFSHYEKTLEFEPRRTRVNRESVMHFDLSTFGLEAKIEIEIEDHAGKISRGAVFVAPRSACPNG